MSASSIEVPMMPMSGPAALTIRTIERRRIDLLARGEIRQRRAVPRRVGAVAGDEDVLRAADLVEPDAPFLDVLEIAIGNEHIHRRLPVRIRIPVARRRPAPRGPRRRAPRAPRALCPTPPCRHLHVRDLDGDAGAAPDVDRLASTRRQPRSLRRGRGWNRGRRYGLIADASAANSAGWRVEAGVVLEAARQPDGAVLHRALHERSHHGDLAVGRRALEVGAEHEAAHRAVPDAGGDVDGRPRSLDPLEEVGDGQVAAAVLADQRGGDALLHLARGVGVIHEAAIRMAVHVDEPGRHDAAGGIDAPARPAPRSAAAQPRRWRRRRYANVNLARRAAGAVDDAAVLDEQCAGGMALTGKGHQARHDEDTGSAHVAC